MKGDIDNRRFEFGPDTMPRRKPVDADAFELDSQYMGDLQRIIRHINSVASGTKIHTKLIFHRDNLENEHRRPELGLRKTFYPRGFINKVFELDRKAVVNDTRRKGVEQL